MDQRELVIMLPALIATVALAVPPVAEPLPALLARADALAVQVRSVPLSCSHACPHSLILAYFSCSGPMWRPCCTY